ncbi:alpha/beta fold hydrolase [Burkholderia sp. 22PA0106]|uniref:alpha/beta fold hydrolase n=1 Tax=Burkholderia sp. 22PA0106 TaxID=3237371 RepID=UPI0039C1DC7E
MQIQTNGLHLDIHVSDSGNRAAGSRANAPALVFLHYWGGSSRTWDAVVAPLRARCRTVAIDHRGWGDSSAPADGYAMADLARDAQAVIESLALTRYVLVGHSMGGKVAQLLASWQPRGLAGVVLVAPSPPSPMAVPAEQRAAMAQAYASRESVGQVLDAVLTSRPLPAALREQAIADSLRGAPQAKAAWPGAGMLEDIGDAVGRIDVPVRVIAGERDQVERVEVLRRELLPRIAGARFEVLPDVGHLLPLEAPDALVQRIGAFLDELDSACEANVRLMPEQVPQAFDAAFNAGDVEAVLALFDDDATMRMADGIHTAHGKPALRAALGPLLAGRPHIVNRVRRTLTSGDVALVLLDWTVRMTLPDGREATQSGTATQVMARGADGRWALRISNPLGTADGDGAGDVHDAVAA